MNIFYLSKDHDIAARLQYNKHVVKMILETAQLLCTAHHILGSSIQIPYKSTHKNHPSAVWVRYSKETYLWTYNHMVSLGEEYTRRYSKTHLTIEKCKEVLNTYPSGMQSLPWIDPPQCMPDEYKDSNPVKGYWNYYLGEKHKVCNADETRYSSIPNIILKEII